MNGFKPTLIRKSKSSKTLELTTSSEIPLTGLICMWDISPAPPVWLFSRSRVMLF